MVPWFSKVCTDNEAIACNFITYINDVRPTGPTAEKCWLTAWCVASMCTYLGIQDAAQKQRSSSCTAGAWAGLIVHTNNGEIKVDSKKWRKTKAAVAWIPEELEPQGNGQEAAGKTPGLLGLCGLDLPVDGTIPQGDQPHLGWLERRKGRMWMAADAD